MSERGDRSRTQDAQRAGTPCATVGHPLASPSGRYLLHSIPGPDENGVHTSYAEITTTAGERLYRSELPMSVRHGICFLWSERVDIAWVGSKDIGLTVLKPTPAGDGWTQTQASAVDPTDVPPLIRANHPRAFSGTRPT